MLPAHSLPREVIETLTDQHLPQARTFFLPYYATVALPPAQRSSGGAIAQLEMLALVLRYYGFTVKGTGWGWSLAIDQE